MGVSLYASMLASGGPQLLDFYFGSKGEGRAKLRVVRDPLMPLHTR